MSQAMLKYFSGVASSWSRYRKSRAYYWNQVSQFMAFYSNPHAKVLEIGCAMGDTLAQMPAARRVGIDFCPELIEQARAAHPDIEFHVMEAENITLQEKFDVVIMSNLIGYLDDIELVLTQVQRVCHQKTRIIIGHYNRLWEPLINLAEAMHIKRKSPEQNWLSKADVSNLLFLAGFETYRTNSCMLMPFGIPLLAPLLNRFVSHLPLMGALSLNNYLFARPLPPASCSEALSKAENVDINNVGGTNGTITMGDVVEEDSEAKESDDWRTRYSVSVIIPARNESGNIADAVRRVPDMGSHTEIIFVEGNSTDDTWQVIQEAKAQSTRDISITQQEGKGKGDAVRKGFGMAKGDILMILDADLTVSPEDLPKFYRAIATGKGEFINGVRLVYPMEKGSMRLLNTLGNHFFSSLFSWVLETPVKDTLCGTKVMFRKDYELLAAGRDFFGDFDPFGDFDMLFGAHKLNLRMVDLPIRYKERKYGTTNISRFRHGLLLLKMSAFAALKIRFR